MLGAMSGMLELEFQVSELVMNMVSCSKLFLVGYNAIEKALYIRGMSLGNELRNAGQII